MHADRQEKAVFVAATGMGGSGAIYSRVGTDAAIDEERKAYRLLTLAGYTIVIFTSDAIAVCTECHEGTRTCDPRVRRNRQAGKQVMPFLQATEELGIDLARSWMVSDRLDNIEIGRLVGCNTILWTNGSETDWDMTAMRWPDLIARDIWEIACLIVNAGSTSVAWLPDQEDDQDE